VRTLVRIKYAKEGRLVALSHLETMHALLRAFRRARLPMAFSQGFHPKPKISFGPALSVGIESRAELLDLELIGPADPGEVAARLAPELPPGLTLLDVEALPDGAQTIGETLRAVHYVATIPGESGELDRLLAQVEAFHGSAQSVVHRSILPKNKDRKRHQKIAPRKQRAIDLKDIVTHLGVEGPGRVAFSLRVDPTGSARPAEVLAAIFGTEGMPPRGVKVLKEGVSLVQTGRIGPSGQPRLPHDLDA
jgi:radical SAM-linked protein